MSAFSATLNAGASPTNVMYFGGATNTLQVTESSPPDNPFSTSTTASLAYSTPGVTYVFSNVVVTYNSTTSLTVKFSVSATSGIGIGGSLLDLYLTTPEKHIQLQIPESQ